MYYRKIDRIILQFRGFQLLPNNISSKILIILCKILCFSILLRLVILVFLSLEFINWNQWCTCLINQVVVRASSWISLLLILKLQQFFQWKKSYLNSYIHFVKIRGIEIFVSKMMKQVKRLFRRFFYFSKITNINSWHKWGRHFFKLLQFLRYIKSCAKYCTFKILEQVANIWIYINTMIVTLKCIFSITIWFYCHSQKRLQSSIIRTHTWCNR